MRKGPQGQPTEVWIVSLIKAGSEQIESAQRHQSRLNSPVARGHCLAGSASGWQPRTRGAGSNPAKVRALRFDGAGPRALGGRTTTAIREMTIESISAGCYASITRALLLR